MSAQTAQLHHPIESFPHHRTSRFSPVVLTEATPASPVMGGRRTATAVSDRLRAGAFRTRQYLAGAPSTLLLLFAFTATWWTLRGADLSTVHALLVSASTNLNNLARDPVQVLVASAFWSDSTSFPWGVVAEFLVVLVAAERWLGSWRWILTFIAGHVGATLIVAGGITWAVQHELLPDSLAGSVDVGTSYGFWAVAALLTYRFPGWHRGLWAATVVVVLSVAAWQQHTFTDAGHLTAMTIGFSLYPLTRGPNARLAAEPATSGIGGLPAR